MSRERNIDWWKYVARALALWFWYLLISMALGIPCLICKFILGE